MANQLIHRVRATGLGQIPGATFETGAAAGFQNLARVFDGIANRLADREDQTAKRAGAAAGARAGAAGAFERKDDATLRGEAFNIAATTTFQQTTSAKVKVRLAEYEREFADNSTGYSNAVTAYSRGVIAEVEKVSPEIAEIFAQELELRRGQGEARIFKAERGVMKDKATASALVFNRGLEQEVNEAARDLDLTDIKSTTEFVSNVLKMRAEQRLTYSGTGPTGIPLFTDLERTNAALAFDDVATTAMVVSSFNQLIASNQRGLPGQNAVEALDAFEAGNDIKFTVAGADGKPETRTLSIRDDLRKTVIGRMRASISAANSQVTFAQQQSDRALREWSDGRLRDMNSSGEPLEYLVKLEEFRADPRADPDDIKKAIDIGSYLTFGENTSRIEDAVSGAKRDVLTGQVTNIEQLDQNYPFGLDAAARLELVDMMQQRTKASFFTNSLPYKTTLDRIRGEVAPNVVAGEIQLRFGASDKDAAASDFNRIKGQLMERAWDAQQDGTMPSDTNAVPGPGEFDFRAVGEELLSTWRSTKGNTDGQRAKLEQDIKDLNAELKVSVELKAPAATIQRIQDGLSATQRRLDDLLQGAQQ